MPARRSRIICDCGSGTGEEPSGGDVLRLIQIRLTAPSLEEIPPACQAKRDRLSSPTASHAAMIRVYNDAGNVIETREHTGDFKEW